MDNRKHQENILQYELNNKQKKTPFLLMYNNLIENELFFAISSQIWISKITKSKVKEPERHSKKEQVKRNDRDIG